MSGKKEITHEPQALPKTSREMVAFRTIRDLDELILDAERRIDRANAQLRKDGKYLAASFNIWRIIRDGIKKRSKRGNTSSVSRRANPFRIRRAK